MDEPQRVNTWHAGASWFETRGVAALLTMRVQDLILRRRDSAVSKDEATEREILYAANGTVQAS
jgi:hypothetical protein